MIRILLLLGFIFCSFPSLAKIVTASSEYIHSGEISPKEACEIAKQRAKLKAIEKVLGQVVSSEETEKCMEIDGKHECERNQIFMHSFNGNITDLKTLKKNDGVRDIEGQNFYFCEVKIEAEVTPSYENSDPNFDFAVALNEKIFREGEKMQIFIESSQPMYLTIFQWFPYNKKNNQVKKLFPNEREKNNKIPSDKISLPMKGTTYKVFFPENLKQNRVDEYLFLVGSKENIKWLLEYPKIEDLKKTISRAKNNNIVVVKKDYSIMR